MIPLVREDGAPCRVSAPALGKILDPAEDGSGYLAEACSGLVPGVEGTRTFGSSHEDVSFTLDGIHDCGLLFCLPVNDLTSKVAVLQAA